jgi:hypothetical protein
MLAHLRTPFIASFTPPKWLREILLSVGIAARAITVFAAAVAFGVLVVIKVGEDNLWIAAAIAAGVLLLVVLPVRLWWVARRSR